MPEMSASSVSGNHFLKSEDIRTPEKTPWSYPNQAMDARARGNVSCYLIRGLAVGRRREGTRTGIDYGDEDDEPRPVEPIAESQHLEGAAMILASKVP